MHKQEIKSAVVWGDSLAKGVIFDESRNRYRLAASPAVSVVAEKLGIKITNRSRMGMTTGQGLVMMEKDLEKGLHADAAVIEFGGNDCDFNWKEISDSPEEQHLPKTPADEYEKNMKTMIQKVKDAGMEPILVNLPPIDPNQYFEFFSSNGLSQHNIMKWLGNVLKIYKFQESYSLMVNRIAKECGCRLIDIRTAFLKALKKAPLLCHDGIHPTEKGQELIGEVILESI